MTFPTESQRWVLHKRPYGEPVPDGNEPTFVLEKAKIPTLNDGQVLLKTVYFSNGPAQRTWISPFATKERQYVPPVEVGELMRAMGIAVQIAKKMIGCRKVIGIARTDAKCKWVEEIGADVCLNYKSDFCKERLTKETDGWVEICFDNVGGEILDFMLTCLAKFGRVAACGTISNYNREGDIIGIKNLFEKVMRLQILGFININWLDHLSDVRKILVDEWKQDTLIIDNNSEMIVEAEISKVPPT